MSLRASFTGYRVGATLYMPVLHPKAREILAGRVTFGRASVVLCLEDALSPGDVDRGLEHLRTGLAARQTAPPEAPLVFVRPRDLRMAGQIAHFDGIDRIAGVVAPKLTTANMAGWFNLPADRIVQVMPTLETPEFFSPGALSEMADALRPHASRIAAIRIGGNDLLGALALRRERGMTSYEGPLAWMLSMITSLFLPAGLPVAAPVYDVLDDLDTLSREVRRDVAQGFVAKTAIHPAQVPLIEAAFAVEPDDLAKARALLGEQPRAVFQLGGAMCEPATHRAWAERVLARHARFGLRAESGSRAPEAVGVGG